MRFYRSLATLAFVSYFWIANLTAESVLSSVSFPQEIVLTTNLPFAVSAIAADFDGDGRTDVAAASLRNSQIAWYRNNGDGTFTGPILISSTALGPSGLAAADIDSDGRIDLASASVLDNKIAWYRNVGGPPSGVFGSAGNQRIISTSAKYAASVAVADVNGDGLLDIASASMLDNKIAWYRNLGGGNFGWTAANPSANQKVISTASVAPSCVAAGDLDGDGVIDVAVSSINDNTLAWLKGSIAGDGTISFTRHVISTTQLRAQSLSIADVNRDNRPDLLCAAPFGYKVTYFRNATQGPSAVAPFFAPEQVISSDARGASAVIAVDLDRDGNLDIITASLLDNKIAWHLGSGPDATGAVTFGPEQLISSNAMGVASVCATDFNGDGALDLASSSHDDAKVAVYINGGDFSRGITLVPTLAAPASGTLTTSLVTVSYTLPEGALEGSLKLAFANGEIFRELVLATALGTAGAHTFSFDPAAPGTSSAVQSGPASIPDGTYIVTLSYQDAQSNPAASATPATGVVIDIAPPFYPEIVTTVLAIQGGVVPGAGEVGSGVPAGAIFRNFGVPSTNEANQVAVTVKYSSSTGTRQVILGPALNAETSVLVSGGDPVPNHDGSFLNGLEFASFKDVLLNDTGSIAFIGKVRGVGTTVAAITSANDSGIWTNTASGQLRLVAREGDAAPGLATTFKGFNSVALSTTFEREDEATRANVAFVAQLQGAGVTPANDHGLWIYESASSADSSLRLLLRERQMLSLRGGVPKRVNSFFALAAPSRAVGHGRGAVPAGAMALVNFVDGSQALVRFEGNGAIQEAAVALDAVPGTNASLARFGLPVQNTRGDTLFVASLTGMAKNSALIFVPAEGGETFAVRQGDTAEGVNKATFWSFMAGVVNQEQRIAFVANLVGKRVNSANDETIWQVNPSVAAGPELIAREGAQPPGVPTGARWKSFTSVVLPDGARGPVFIADLVVPPPGSANPANVKARNDTGVWAVDSAGVLRLIVREGDLFPGTQKKIRALTLLGNVSGSPAQTRSFNGNVDLIYRATLSDGSQAIAKVRVP